MKTRATATRLVDERLAALFEELVCFVRKQAADSSLSVGLVQVSLLAAVESVSDSRQPEATIPWLYRILRRVTAEVSRAEGGYMGAETDHPLFPDSLALDSEQKFVGACLKRIMPTLAPANAEILERVDLGGETVDAVAAERGAPVSSVTLLLLRARGQLRDRLLEACARPALDVVCCS